MNRERLVVAGLFSLPVLVAVAMVAWSAGQPAAAQTTASSRPFRPLRGFTQPSDIVDLASSEKGIIETLHIEEGDTVKKGQVVCQLESSVERASLEVSKTQAESMIDIEVARIGYDLAKVELRRLEHLDERDAAAPMELIEAQITEKYRSRQIEKAEYDKRVIEVQYARDQKILARRTVRSPLDGYVAQKAKSVGELVDGVDDTIICQIVKLHPLHVLVPAPADFYGKVAVGDTARLEGEQLPGGKATAKVILVDRIVQADSETYAIKLVLPNPDSVIPAGIRVTATFR